MKDMPGGEAPLMEAIASFRVRIDSSRDGTWQGVVETNGSEYPFRNELELLNQVMEQFPALRPEVTWDSNR